MPNNNPDFRLKNYDLSDFDENMNLKFGSINTLILIYLLSPIAIAFISSNSKGGSGLQILKASFLTKDIMYLSLIGTLPVIVFLIAFLVKKRIALIENIKRQGKHFMMTTAIINALMWSYVVVHSGYKSNLFHILSMAISYISLLYILKSKHLKDYFLTRFTNSPN